MGEFKMKRYYTIRRTMVDTYQVEAESDVDALRQDCPKDTNCRASLEIVDIKNLDGSKY